MAVHPILRYPDPGLMVPCAPVGAVTDDIRLLAADMLETMYAAPGRGLAAPQVGVTARMFVMDCGWKDGTPTPLVCIDPTVTPTTTDTAQNDEGCLSIPGVTAPITRPAAIRLEYTGLDGARHARALDGFAAACAQHENDHLDGVLTFDHLDAGARAALIHQYESLPA